MGGRFLQHLLIYMVVGALVAGCASVVSSATGGLADNLSTAILNQNDPETVRDGAPAFLLMLDSFAAGSPDDPAMLGAAAELYAAYGVLFVEDPERAARLTDKAQNYARRGLCASNDSACGIEKLRYKPFVAALDELEDRDVEALYTYALSWIAYIRANSSDMTALTKLPRAEAALRRVQALDSRYREADIEHYLGVLSTIRPPALGGQFDAGLAHFERAIELTKGQDLSIKVDFARYYARTLYERELHDQLLNQVLEADAEAEGLTLFNVLAQREAASLLASGDDYF